MAQRLKAAALILAILVVGFSAVIALTEHQAGANAAERLLTTSDIVEALGDQGIVIDPVRSPANHPLIRVPGTTLTVASSVIEVYVFPSVRDRVADEQVMQRKLMQLQAFASSEDSPLRITSVRNILLLYYADSAVVADAVHSSARSLSRLSEQR